jgi:UDP-N-acetylglucosamine 2-epimerase (non-hydrolysing)
MLAIIYGTRPEFLKLYPLILEAKKREISFISINTGQHTDLLTEMEKLFDFEPNFRLKVQSDSFTNSNLVAKLINDIANTVKAHKVNKIIAQGDTFTVLSSSLVAFVEKIDFYHIEAGLRTSDIRLPFPEEYNRRVVSLGTNIHFAPTLSAKENLLKENISEKDIVVTGNTIIDLLKYVLEHQNISLNNQNKVFITAHRRENIGQPMQDICQAISELALENPSIDFIWSLHPNPNTQKLIFGYFKETPKNLIFSQPLNYIEAVKLMSQSRMIISDSGGIQEEAPTLGKRVIVLRTETERPEVVECGCGVLVGTDIQKIKEEFYKELNKSEENKWENPFGKGNASQIIFDKIYNQEKSLV